VALLPLEELNVAVPQFRLKGELSEGMFPNERVVTVRDHTGQERTLIAPETSVLGSTILVKLVDKAGDIALVRLPGDLLDSGRMLSVRDSELEPA